MFLILFCIYRCVAGEALKVVGCYRACSGLRSVLVVSDSDQNMRIRCRCKISTLFLVVKVGVESVLKLDSEEQMLLLPGNLVEIQKTFDEEGIVIGLSDRPLALTPTSGEFARIRVIQVAFDKCYSVRSKSFTPCRNGILFSREDDGTQGKSGNL